MGGHLHSTATQMKLSVNSIWKTISMSNSFSFSVYGKPLRCGHVLNQPIISCQTSNLFTSLVCLHIALFLVLMTSSLIHTHSYYHLVCHYLLRTFPPLPLTSPAPHYSLNIRGHVQAQRTCAQPQCRDYEYCLVRSIHNLKRVMFLHHCINYRMCNVSNLILNCKTPNQVTITIT